MSGLKFTKHGYKIQADKRMKENNGVGYVLRNLVSVENMLVMNEKQFRWFYEKFSGHQLLGGENEDLNCLKLIITKELLLDIIGKIDERGFYYEKEEEDKTTEQQII